jgi:hypothetical protein
VQLFIGFWRAALAQGSSSQPAPFVGCFYHAWIREWDMLLALVKAHAEWVTQTTGVVLWSWHLLAIGCFRLLGQSSTGREARR